MYTIETLKPLNTVFDENHRLDQSDADMANAFVKLIESTRGEKPCPGDIIEYTNEYGNYCENTHIRAFDDKTGHLSVRICPYVPIVYQEDDGKIGWRHTGGGPCDSVDAASLTYIGKREKLFAVFSGHCILPAHSAVYFNAQVNIWEYIAPDQKHPGYSTKDWVKQYISYRENPVEGCEYRYYGQNIAFRTAAEYQLWKDTYKAVEFPGGSPNQTILFLYRESDRLISREEWDALDFPLDTRMVNGIIPVKVDYDDDAHMITVYRFTNSGYLDARKFGPYERARGTVLETYQNKEDKR